MSVEPAESELLDLPRMTDLETVASRGVKGIVNGKTDRVGRPDRFEYQQLYLPNSL